MSRVAGEAGTARRRLTAVPVAARVERLPLIALGSRLPVRARHTRHGCGVIELLAEREWSGVRLVTLTNAVLVVTGTPSLQLQVPA